MSNRPLPHPLTPPPVALCLVGPARTEPSVPFMLARARPAKPPPLSLPPPPSSPRFFSWRAAPPARLARRRQQAQAGQP
jgi:hypothetical protein